jgi:hypothetical protein
MIRRRRKPEPGPAPASAQPADEERRTARPARALTQRQFLKALAAAVGIAGVAQLAAPPRAAKASYIENYQGSGRDLVTVPLIVNGELLLPQRTAGGSYSLVWRNASSSEYRTNIDPSGTLSFETEDRASTLVLTRSHLVGIGMASPAAELHLGGASPNLVLVGMTTNDQDGLRVHYNASLRTGVIDTKGSVFLLRGESGSTGAGATERVRIDLTTGNVGIANSNPQALLHLGGGALKIGPTLIADSGGVYYAP